MRVKKCNIKAWPHPAHKRHKPCLGIRLLANVTGGGPCAGQLLQLHKLLPSNSVAAHLLTKTFAKRHLPKDT